MRKRLMILAGLALVLTIIGLISLLARGEGGPPCQKLIVAIQRGDLDGSYQLFTTRAQTLITAEQWKKQATILKSVYGDAAPKLLKQATSITDPITNKTSGQQIEYGIEQGGAKYKATCTIADDEPKKVDAFTSRVGF